MATSAVVAGAAYLGTRKNTELPQPKRTLHVLDELSFGVLTVMAGRILPFEGAEALDVAHGIDEALRYATPEAQADLQVVLAVLENRLSGLLTRGSSTLFSELDDEGQDRAIACWGRSRVAMLRGATNSLRKLCLGTFYAPLEHAKSIDYLGPPFEVPAPPPIQARSALSPPYVPKSARAEPEAPAADEGPGASEGPEEVTP